MIVGYALDMSADDKDTIYPTTSEETSDIVKNVNNKISDEKCEKTAKPSRKVSFPKEEQLVTKYFEPFNPWEDGKHNPVLILLENKDVHFFVFCNYVQM